MTNQRKISTRGLYHDAGAKIEKSTAVFILYGAMAGNGKKELSADFIAHVLSKMNE